MASPPKRYMTAADATAINVQLTALALPTIKVQDQILAQSYTDELAALSAPLAAIVNALDYVHRFDLVIDPSNGDATFVESISEAVADSYQFPDVFIRQSSATPTPVDFSFAGNPFDKIEFNLVPNPAYQEGCLFYDTNEKSLAVYNSEPDVTHQVGQEFYVRVKNESGATITNGSLVYISGDDNVEHRPIIERAIATSEATSNVIGMATHDIENGTFGFITKEGLVNDVVTTGFPAGAELFLSESTLGGYRVGPPPAGNIAVPIGWNVRSHPSEGRILVSSAPRHTTEGGSFNSFITHSVTWHHDAGRPNDVNFNIDLSTERLGDAGWLTDRYAHQYFGPAGAVTLRIICSNNDVINHTVFIQEILESEFNTDFSAAPKVPTIGSFVIPPGNHTIDVAANMTAGDGIENAAIIYYYSTTGSADLRILGISVTQ